MKDVTTRLYEVSDYPEICEWWRARAAHGWTYVPLHALPQVGFIAEAEGEKLGCVFVYHGEAGWRWVEWLTTNPACSPRDSLRVINTLLERALEAVRQSGGQFGISSLDNDALIRIFEKHGFRRGGGGMTDMIWSAEG